MFPLQNDTVALKQSELRQQKSLTAEEDRRRMNLLNALSRGHTTTSDDSESFCEYNNFLLKELLPEPAIMRFAQNQPRPQGLLAFQNGGGSGEDPGTQQITCLQRGWRCIQNGGYGEKGEKNWVRDAKVKINKMAEKAEVQFKKK